jgi:F0F1-type ATP synthase gamma subunit
MNFHSLLRVDKARKKADKYLDVGSEITEILSTILYNKNLVLDKKVLIPDESRPILDIYIANDYGFCGDFNAAIRRSINKNKDNYKIIIGNKITYKDDKTVMKLEKDKFNDEFRQIENYIDKSLIEMSYREINVYYNHYYSSTDFEFKKIRLFPIEFTGEYYEGKDFLAETDLEKMIKSLVSFYICYQIKMCECISEAAENMERNQITSKALDKIEEIEIEQRNKKLRENTEKSIKKSVENYKKMIIFDYEE